MTPDQARKAYQRRSMRRRVALLITAAAGFPMFKLAELLLSDDAKASLAGSHLGMVLGLAVGVLFYLGVSALMLRWMPLSDDERAA